MRKITCTFLLFFGPLALFSQEENVEEKEQALKSSTNYTWEGNKKLSENNFIAAEVDYRKAISESPENAAAPYNLGNAYYNNQTFSEAFGRFKQAGEAAASKTDKHKAYHNMGNVFMKRKDYAKAVDAYKEALRNNPKDEETRYNLALAKEMLKKDEQKNDQNQDKNDENKDQEDKKDKDQDKEGDNKDKNDQNQDQKDKGDEGDKGDEKKDENKEGDGDKKEEQKKKPEQGEGDKPQEQEPRPNQLSKQQVDNLLRAMQNAEKKVQDKIDAKKVKGAKIKNEKDW